MFQYVRNRCGFARVSCEVTWATEGSAGIVAALGLVRYLSRVAVEVQVCREAARLDGHEVSADTCTAQRLTFPSSTTSRLKESSVLRLAKKNKEKIPPIYHFLLGVTVFRYPSFIIMYARVLYALYRSLTLFISGFWHGQVELSAVHMCGNKFLQPEALKNRHTERIKESRTKKKSTKKAMEAKCGIFSRYRT